MAPASLMKYVAWKLIHSTVSKALIYKYMIFARIHAYLYSKNYSYHWTTDNHNLKLLKDK